MVKLFSHRGYSPNPGPADNSIASLHRAVKQGFDAVEIDIWFIDGEFILTHDAPKADEIAQLDRLEDYLAIYGDKLRYWLDFKNLQDCAMSDVLPHLKKALSGVSLENFYFVPCVNADYHSAFAILNVIGDYFGSQVKLAAFYEGKNLALLKDLLAKNQKVRHLSVQYHHLLDPDFMKELPDLEFLAWTVNNKQDLSALSARGISIVATDQSFNDLSIY